MGFVKGLVYVPLLPKDIDKLKAQIMEAVAIIDNAMLECIWQELDFWLDVCCVTNSAHIKHLEHSMKNLRLKAFKIYQMQFYFLNYF